MGGFPHLYGASVAGTSGRPVVNVYVQPLSRLPSLGYVASRGQTGGFADDGGAMNTDEIARLDWPEEEIANTVAAFIRACRRLPSQTDLERFRNGFDQVPD